ncbi:MAG: hypothetical protein ACD_20C00157G0009 [uncultured bacterium]|nr:MAG: hypothetical protein ACD_20C00157G0009 [uncultured bacterium]HBH18090.1 hypothetical protein [Cyanobacteria bacterium UBA9579]
MNLPNKWASDLLGKDKQKAQTAAEYIINTPDIEAWQCLIDNSEYIFSYIKERAGKNLVKATNTNNVENILSLIKYHSTDWDDCIAECLKNNANETINNKLQEMLNSGTAEEKAYIAKYYSYVAINQVKDALFEATKDKYDPLRFNAAQALGKLNDRDSYNYFIKKLETNDDWEKVAAAEFLSNYNNKEAAIPILKAMSNSSMAEYLAGEAVNLVDICEFFWKDEETQVLAFEAFDHILSGLAEVWGLAAIFDFKIYECIENLIKIAKENPDSNLSGKYAQLLLKAKSKISLFIGNSQYTFDEERTVIKELEEIYHLLECENEDFWNKQTENINKELYTTNIKRKLSTIAIINELELTGSVSHLKDTILNTDESEIVICEALLTLIKLGFISQIDNISSLLTRIKDENLLAVIRNSLSYAEHG